MQDKIYVFGGEPGGIGNSKIEKYDRITKRWTDGPLLPCYLNKSYGDNAVMSRQGKIILIIKGKEIDIFDPEDTSIESLEGQFEIEQNYSMYKYRNHYASLLM